MTGDSRLRSLIKAIIFRIIMTVVGLLIAYAFTGSLTTALWIFLAHGAAAIVLYYLHERVWKKIKLR